MLGTNSSCISYYITLLMIKLIFAFRRVRRFRARAGAVGAPRPGSSHAPSLRSQLSELCEDCRARGGPGCFTAHLLHLVYDLPHFTYLVVYP